MYLIPVEVRKSDIDGKGVFAKENIKSNTIVWKYKEGHDRKMTKLVFDQLSESTRVALLRIAYLSPTSDMWVMPPEDDPACYTNHNLNSHNLSVIVDKTVSDEPFFVANRDINAGEEVTNNYLEFDQNSATDKFVWLKL